MKKLLLICLALCVGTIIDNTAQAQTTTDYGEMVKYVDVRIYNIPLVGASLTLTRSMALHLRYYYNSDKMYCCIINRDGGLTTTISLCYEELVQVNKAIHKLMKEFETDKSMQLPCLCNEYKTNSNFSLGYILEEPFVRWFITFCDEKLYIKNESKMTDAFVSIQSEMEKKDEWVKLITNND